MSDYPQQLLSWFLDIVFPKTCLNCGNFTGKGDFDYICKKCFGKIRVKNNFECIGCKKQVQLGFTCIQCGKEDKIDQLLISAELSDQLVEDMLKVYKYKFIPNIVTPLSVIFKKYIKKLLLRDFNIFEDNPLIIPVPLYKRRLNWRGFNQAGLLAKNLADTYHVSYNDEVLIRIANPKHQADIRSREERLDNVKNNFVVSNDEIIKSRTIVLVDDICTTGATLNECAKVLKNPPAGGGAKKVIGFVIARG